MAMFQAVLSTSEMVLIVSWESVPGRKTIASWNVAASGVPVCAVNVIACADVLTIVAVQRVLLVVLVQAQHERVIDPIGSRRAETGLHVAENGVGCERLVIQPELAHQSGECIPGGGAVECRSLRTDTDETVTHRRIGIAERQTGMRNRRSVGFGVDINRFRSITCMIGGGNKMPFAVVDRNTPGERISHTVLVDRGPAHDKIAGIIRINSKIQLPVIGRVERSNDHRGIANSIDPRLHGNFRKRHRGRIRQLIDGDILARP
jgi:hypothetical protein